jgi:hypothetical protein
MTTTVNATPSHKLSLGASSNDSFAIVNAIKHKIAPIQRRAAKPPNNCLQNLSHSGVVFGGDNAFFPSLASTILACSSVIPLKFRFKLVKLV